MKKLLSAAIALTILLSLAGCGETAQADEKSGSDAATSAHSETELSGTIKSVDGNSITITTDDGAEKAFTVNDSTVYTMETGEISMDDFQQGGTPPEMPSGDNQQGGTPPEMPSGDNQQGGTPPEMPSGDNQQGGTPPEMPSGDNRQDGSAVQMPSGDIQQSGATPDIQREGGEGMQIGPDMLTVGTAVTVTVSDDGIAAEIKIKMSGAPLGDFGKK